MNIQRKIAFEQGIRREVYECNRMRSKIKFKNKNMSQL